MFSEKPSAPAMSAPFSLVAIVPAEIQLELPASRYTFVFPSDFKVCTAEESICRRAAWAEEVRQSMFASPSGSRTTVASREPIARARDAIQDWYACAVCAPPAE